MTAPARLLEGRQVVVTRSREQASELVARLADLGAIVIELPVIAIADADDGGAGIERAAHRLAGGAYAWVVVTSQNAVGRLVMALGTRRVPETVRWAAVGRATARSLAEVGHPADLVPDTATGDSLAQAFPDPEGPGGSVLFARAETVRGDLAGRIRGRGWGVDEVVVYRTVAGDPEPDALLRARRAEAVAFTSSSTVDRTVGLLGADQVPPLVVSIGPVTSASASAAGLQVAAEASEATIQGLVKAVVSAFAGADPAVLP